MSDELHNKCFHACDMQQYFYVWVINQKKKTYNIDPKKKRVEAMRIVKYKLKLIVFKFLYELSFLFEL